MNEQDGVRLLALAEKYERDADLYQAGSPAYAEDCRLVAAALRAAPPSRLDAGSVLAKDMMVLLDHAIACLEETMTGRTSKIQTAISNINLVKNTLAALPALPAGEEPGLSIEHRLQIVRRTAIEECAIYLEKIGARYHYGKNLPAHLRALSPSSNGKPATENK